MRFERLRYGLLAPLAATVLAVMPAPAAAELLPWVAGDLPWLADPLGAADKIKPYVTNARLKPASCPSIPNKGHVYTLEEAVVLSLCNNPDTKAAYLALVQQANSYVQNYSSYFPDVTATASWSKNTFFSPNSNSIGRDSGVSAEVTLYDFGQRELSIDAAEQTLIAAGYGYDSTLQGIIAAALNGYYSLLTSQNGVAVAEESERFAKASFDAAKLRHDIGQVALADELQAKSSYSQAILATQQAHNQLAQDKATLARLMGLPPEETVEVAELNDNALVVEPLGEQLPQLLAKAQEKRVDLIAQRAQVEAAKTSLRKTQRENLATVSAGVNADLDRAGIFTRGTTRSHSIGLSVSIPIFNGFNQTYNEQSAKAAVEAEQEALAQTELNVSQDVWNAWHNYQTSQKSWDTSLDLLDSATEFKDVALGRYKEGVGTILDVLSAQSQYRSALQSQLQARYNLLTTRIDLVRAVGVLGLDTMHPESTVQLSSEPNPMTP